MTLAALALAFATSALLAGELVDDQAPVRRCFLLHEIGVGEVRRAPADACDEPVTPASTFKVPHALAALEAGVLDGPDAELRYDGSPQPFEAWQQNHTLRTAIRDSVVWYFQEVARRLGMEREREYLARFRYGNADPSSGLTDFWLAGSLRVSPAEQIRFLTDLFTGGLDAAPRHQEAVRRMLEQPPGRIANAMGSQPFGSPAPDTVVSAKTGSSRDASGLQVRWIVGHVARAGRAWVFASLVAGPEEVPARAAVVQAAEALVDEGVLRP